MIFGCVLGPQVPFFVVNTPNLSLRKKATSEATKKKGGGVIFEICFFQKINPDHLQKICFCKSDRCVYDFRNVDCHPAPSVHHK